MEIINDKVFRDPNGFYKIDTVFGNEGVMPYRQKDGSVKYGYLPKSELQKAMDSIKNKPLTNTHPKGGVVTPANYKKLSVGFVDGAGVSMVGNKVVGSVIVASDEGIEAINGGRTDVSLGYGEVKDFTSGTFVDDQGEEHKYDYVKRSLTYNHLALVDNGRAKDAELILDSAELDLDTNQETVTLDSGDFKTESIKETITNTPNMDYTQVLFEDRLISIQADAADSFLAFAKKAKKKEEEEDSKESKMEALKAKNEKLEKDSADLETVRGELAALKSLATDSAEQVTDADVIAQEATERLAAWTLVNSLSNDSIDFVPTQTALETKRAFIADQYDVENVADASEQFLNGMISVLSKTNKNTVSGFVADTAPTTPAQSTARAITPSTIATDSYDDGSFSISLG